MKLSHAAVLTVVAAGLLLVALAAFANLPGERRVKELLGMNPTGCTVLDRGSDDAWREEPDMPTVRDGPASAVIGTRVFLLGGIASFSEDYDRARSVDTFESFDIRSRRWQQLPALPRPLNHVQLAAVGDTLYALGGNLEGLRAGEATGESWRFDLRANRWLPIAAMPTARGAAGVAVVGSRIYVVGGRAGRVALDTVEAYDTRSGRWSRHASMPTRRDHLGTAVRDGTIYAVGGRREDDVSMGVLEAYDPRADRWTRLPAMPEVKAGFAFFDTPAGLVAAGGENLRRWTLYGSIWRYRPGERRWERVGAMAEPRHGFGAALAGGRLWVFGGSECSGFSPVKDSSSIRMA